MFVDNFSNCQVDVENHTQMLPKVNVQSLLVNDFCGFFVIFFQENGAVFVAVGGSACIILM